MPMNKSALCSSARWSKASYAMWVGRLAIRFARDEGDCALLSPRTTSPFSDAIDIAAQSSAIRPSARRSSSWISPSMDSCGGPHFGGLPKRSSANLNGPSLRSGYDQFPVTWAALAVRKRPAAPASPALTYQAARERSRQAGILISPGDFASKIYVYCFAHLIHCPLQLVRLQCWRR